MSTLSSDEFLQPWLAIRFAGDYGTKFERPAADAPRPAPRPRAEAGGAPKKGRASKKGRKFDEL